MSIAEVKDKKVKNKVPKFKGHAAVGDSWRELGVVGEAYGVSWTLYAKVEKNFDWRALKLVANGKAPHKANYWLNWNGERLARGTDSQKLETGKPELLDMTMRFIGRCSGL